MSGLWKAKGGAQPRGEEENLELLEVILSASGKQIFNWPPQQLL